MPCPDGDNLNTRNMKKELESKKLKDLALTIDKLEDEKLVIKEQMIRALADYQNLVKSSEKRNEISNIENDDNIRIAIATIFLNITDFISFLLLLY